MTVRKNAPRRSKPKKNIHKSERRRATCVPIEAEKEYMKTDEYVEEAAREKLGLVKDNEIVFQEEN